MTHPTALLLCPADPAVSLMLLLRGKISSAKAVAYMAAQVAGAVLGAFLCTIIIPGVTAGAGLGAPGRTERGRDKSGSKHCCPG